MPVTSLPRAPWRRLASLTVPVLLGHLALWHGVSGFAAPAAVPTPTAAQPAIEMHWLAEPPAEAGTAERAAPVEPSVPTPAPRAGRPAHAGRERAKLAEAPSLPPLPQAQPADDEEPTAAEASSIDGLQLAAASSGSDTPTTTPDGPDRDPSDVPTYRTRLPAPVVLVYDLRRGFLSGAGRLAWRLSGKPGAQQYQARLEGSVAGLQILVQDSNGAIDTAGIAPVRFTDKRRKGEQAANFRRDSRRITYSGPSTEYPLVPGTQDRVSWMVQLPAIVAADPKRFGRAGERIEMFVSGARGDADVWTFQVAGTEDVAPGDGNAPGAIKLVREPRKPHDTHVEVWLDPQRQYLPARARLTANGDTLELVLQRTQTPS